MQFLISHTDEKARRILIEVEKLLRKYTDEDSIISIGKYVGGSKEGQRGPEYPQMDCAPSWVNPYPNARRILPQLEWLIQLASCELGRV